MKKKIISVVLMISLTLAMTACGTKNQSPASANKDTTEETAEIPKEDSKETVADDVAKNTSGDIDMSVVKGLKIGFSQCDNSNSWRIAETESMQNTAKEYGAELVYTDASGDIAKQASDIEDMVAQGVDYIVLAPQEEDGLQGALKSAKDAGIGVILVDRGINGEAGTFYDTAIMSDFVWEAEQVAKRIIEETGGKGNIVILQGTQGATATNDRQKGFMDAIEGTDLKVVSDQVANYVMAEGQAVMENVLQAQGDDIDVVFAHNDDMALGAITAIKAAGYEPGKDILVTGIDGPVAAMEAILAGEQLCSCSCSPHFGPIAFETIAKMKTGQEVPTEIQNEDVLYDINNADVALGF